MSTIDRSTPTGPTLPSAPKRNPFIHLCAGHRRRADETVHGLSWGYSAVLPFPTRQLMGHQCISRAVSAHDEQLVDRVFEVPMARVEHESTHVALDVWEHDLQRL